MNITISNFVPMYKHSGYVRLPIIVNPLMEKNIK